MIVDASKIILGCFVSSHASLRGEVSEANDAEEKKAAAFRNYIWGETGICDILKQLKHEDYGLDLVRILFKFYVNPVPYLRQHLKEIERYRRDERAIGLPVIVTDENFFNQSEETRQAFLKQSIIQKFDLLRQVVKRNKLDTDIDSLKADLERILR